MTDPIIQAIAAALAPFAERADFYADLTAPEDSNFSPWSNCKITLGDLRRAAEALAALKAMQTTRMQMALADKILIGRLRSMVATQNVSFHYAEDVDAVRAAANRMEEMAGESVGGISELCSDCPPVGYSTDETRCLPCPRRRSASETSPHLPDVQESTTTVVEHASNPAARRSKQGHVESRSGESPDTKTALGPDPVARAIVCEREWSPPEPEEAADLIRAIAAAITQAVEDERALGRAEEREACAELAHSHARAISKGTFPRAGSVEEIGERIAAAIRARGKPDERGGT